MNAKDFLIAHGEKVGVAVVVAFCAWQIASVSSDPAIRSGTGLRLEAMAKDWDEINKTIAVSKPPQLIPPRDYLGQMQGRFGLDQPLAPTMAWLTAHPDLPPTENDKLFLYAYEVLTPTVTAEDNVGTINLQVSLPQPVRPSDRRHTDGRNQAWTRTVQGTQITNRAGILGIQLDVRVGGGAWQPVGANGKTILADGFVPIDRFPTDGKFSVDTIEPWSEHAYRARLVVHATGLPSKVTPAQLQKNTDLTTTVLVWRGRFVDVAENNVNWPQQTAVLRKDAEKYLANTIPPVEKKPPAWAKLGEGELLYNGPESPVATVIATADIRFACTRASMPAPAPIAVPAQPSVPTPDGATPSPTPTPSPAPDAPTGDDPAATSGGSAEILVTRRLADPKGGPAKWIEPQRFVVKVGQAIGGQVEANDPFFEGKKRKVPLETGFILESVSNQGKRIVYYTIRMKGKAGAAGQKEIKVEPFTKTAKEAVLRNVKTGNTITLMVLENIPPPSNVLTVWPWHMNEGYNELDEFKKDPAGFKGGSRPIEPERYEPSSGPLAQLGKDHPELGQINTDSTYFQFSDGRLLWWDNVNKLLTWYPDEPKAKAPAPAPVPAVPPPTPRQPAPRSEPATPRGTTPAPAGTHSGGR